jgi:formylglycine-generating enzyme required for sulfatase activity
MKTITSIATLLCATGVLGSGILLRPSLAVSVSNAATAASGCVDEDRDGYGLGCAAGPDCNDGDPAIHPGQRELCNSRDDDCNMLVDDEPSCPAPGYDESRVGIRSSELLMGSPMGAGAADERPLHRVRLSAFAIDRYEVTNGRYRRCVKAGACTSPALASSGKRKDYFAAQAFARFPVVFVNWQQAEAFCRWDGGRLPSEAEWELAARGPAPSVRIYPWGDNAPDCTRANMGGAGSCVGDTDVVGRRLLGASVWGAADLAGNVWEWTNDWYDANYYQTSPALDPKGPLTGALKVMRGGCFVSGADSLRVSCRKAELPATWAPNVGFRCAY